MLQSFVICLFVWFGLIVGNLLTTNMRDAVEHSFFQAAIIVYILIISAIDNSLMQNVLTYVMTLIGFTIVNCTHAILNGSKNTNLYSKAIEYTFFQAIAIVAVYLAHIAINK